jgi:hypothetical protein
MKQVLIGYKDLAFIVPALKADVNSKRVRLCELASDENAADEKADLVNDLGFLAALIEHLEKELESFYR